METKALSSEYLRKRGSCCKSNCLHCPFGTTLRVIGVKITEKDENNSHIINALIQNLVQKDSLTSSLLDGAFGKQQSYPDDQAYLLSLKGIPCGVVYIEKGKVLKHYLVDEFSDQGITGPYLAGVLCE